MVRMHHRRRKRFRFVPFSQLETEHVGFEVKSLAAAPVQPAGYGTPEGGDPATLVAERDAVGRSLARLPDIWRVPLLLSIVGGFLNRSFVQAVSALAGTPAGATNCHRGR